MLKRIIRLVICATFLFYGSTAAFKPAPATAKMDPYLDRLVGVEAPNIQEMVAINEKLTAYLRVVSKLLAKPKTQEVFKKYFNAEPLQYLENRKLQFKVVHIPGNTEKNIATLGMYFGKDKVVLLESWLFLNPKDEMGNECYILLPNIIIHELAHHIAASVKTSKVPKFKEEGHFIEALVYDATH